MADSADKYKKPIMSSFFNNCPSKLFTSTFTSKVLHETDANNDVSPTSILDSLPPFSAFKNPFFSSESNSPNTTNVAEHKRFWDKLDCCKGLVDALNFDDTQHFPITRTVLFGSQLRMIQTQPPKSASAFGSAISALVETNTTTNNNNNNNSPPVFMRCASVSEMELSEDYTRVICHGPNPRITHILDNCIIGRSSNVADFPAVGRSVYVRDHQNRIRYPSESFLSFCLYCNKDIRGKDIYMYRGERAFCSKECREMGMLFEPPQDLDDTMPSKSN